MGDIIHTLPAAASLKHSIPFSRITWITEPKWMPLLHGNPYIERVLPLDRRTLSSLRQAWRELRTERFDFAVDFQGLLKSAIVANCARVDRIYGFERPRESAAAWLYSNKADTRALHVVDQYLDLAAAAGANSLLHSFPIPPGRREGPLPEGEFVLASPGAGWGAKEWPLENYSILGRFIKRETGMPLLLNAPQPIEVEHTIAHQSGLPGLIDATRRAAAVVGLDSGPLHLAAALGKPGVAIYGPTDPVRNGPYQSQMTVLRMDGALTTHARIPDPAESMRAVTPDMVFEALRPALMQHRS
jgi:heptosyltransferase-1